METTNDIATALERERALTYELNRAENLSELTGRRPSELFYALESELEDVRAYLDNVL